MTVLKELVYAWLPENNRLERIWKLAQVDFKKRYYNDRLGLVWALLNPLFQMGIYYLVFTYVFKSREENFALFLFCGLIIWMSFAECTNRGMHLLNTKRFLIENIQFNHIDLFFSHTISIFIGLMFNLLVFLLLSFLAGLPLGMNILLLPLLLLNLFLVGTGISLMLATLKIYLKDILHIWSTILLLGFWGSGIFFSGHVFLEKLPFFYFGNPFIGIILNFRAIIMKGVQPDWLLLGINMLIGFLILISGIFIFKRYSHKFLETI